MPCYHPLQGWWARSKNASGKRSVVFKRSQGFSDMRMEVACGQCFGCRLERSRQWAVRCEKEAQLHYENCFVTLTYDDAHLPAFRSLRLDDLQRFLKRLRERVAPRRFRFIACGEYGERFKRPHYHLCLFGFDFRSDRVEKRADEFGPVFTSRLLSSVWTLGLSELTTFSFLTAAYTAAYVVKKVTGSRAALEYGERVDEFGEVHAVRVHPFITMSRRPGLGRDWLRSFSSDVFPSDEVLIRKGAASSPAPRAFMRYLEASDPEMFERVKSQRRLKGVKNAWNNTFDRLYVRELVARGKHSLSRRSLND